MNRDIKRRLSFDRKIEINYFSPISFPIYAYYNDQ